MCAQGADPRKNFPVPLSPKSFAGAGSILSVTRIMLGAYGSSTMVSPPPVSSMRCGAEFCARQKVETRANPAKNAKIAEYLFIDYSLEHRNRLKNGCALSVNRLSKGREQEDREQGT